MIKGLRKKPYQHAMSKPHQQNAAKLQTEPQNGQEKVKGIARYVDISNNTLNMAVGVYCSLLSSCTASYLHAGYNGPGWPNTYTYEE